MDTPTGQPRKFPLTAKSCGNRFSRRADDYRIECSSDGKIWKQMRIAHMHEGGGTIRFGICACLPQDSSFKAVFSDFALGECAWLAHDGRQPDE